MNSPAVSPRSTRKIPARSDLRHVLLVLTATAVCLPFVPRASAETFRWVHPKGGQWSVAANWDPQGVPNGSGVVAVIDHAITSNETVRLSDGSTDIEGLVIGTGGASSAEFFWTVTGNSPLAFSGDSASIQSSGAFQQMGGPLVLKSNVRVKAEGTLRLITGNIREAEGSWGFIVEQGMLDIRMPGSITGETIIKQGAKILLARANGLGSGSVVVEEGGMLAFICDGAFLKNELRIAGDGGGGGALRLGSPFATDRGAPREGVTIFKSGGFEGGIQLDGNAAIGVLTGGEGGINSTICGPHTLSKVGEGKLALAGANSFSGGLRVEKGTLALTGEKSMQPQAPVILMGGTLEIGTPSLALGPLALAESSELLLPAELSGSVRFEASAKQAWQSGRMLTIKGWTGDQRGGRFRMLFGNNASGLSSQQLKQIRFEDASGATKPARMIAGGELVPGS